MANLVGLLCLAWSFASASAVFLIGVCIKRGTIPADMTAILGIVAFSAAWFLFLAIGETLLVK